MINAFVLYGTPERASRQVFEIGLALFQTFGIDSYAIHIHRLNRLGYRITKAVTKEELLCLFTNEQEPFSFEISQNYDGRLFYFGQTVRLVNAYNTIKFGGFTSCEVQEEHSFGYIKQILNCVGCQYGFAYQVDNAFKAINYVHDIGISSVNDYDAPMRWQRKFIYIKDDTDYSHHLRIVYQQNYLTANHLSLEIAGKSLQQWIEDDPARGNLSTINQCMWLWQVKPEQLEQVNQQCGDAGLLVSFSDSKNRSLLARRKMKVGY